MTFDHKEQQGAQNSSKNESLALLWACLLISKASRGMTHSGSS
jgi:hypothetical protein